MLQKPITKMLLAACFCRSVRRSTIRSFGGKNLTFLLTAELLLWYMQQTTAVSSAVIVVYQVPESASASSIPKHLCYDLTCAMCLHVSIQAVLIHVPICRCGHSLGGEKRLEKAHAKSQGTVLSCTRPAFHSANGCIESKDANNDRDHERREAGNSRTPK